MTGKDAAPLVSVVTIFLDAEQFLEEAIESVLAQTYERWELLLVDDGSTDGSTTMAQSYAARYPDRIRYLEHPDHENRGMSASRNLGSRFSRGAYVAFLDADDVYLSNKLESQVAVMQAHPEAGMTYGRALIWHSWTGRPEDLQLDGSVDLGVPANSLIRPPSLFRLLLDNKAQSPMTSSAMLRREVIEQVGGFEESFRAMYEDQAFFLKVNLAVPVFVADDFLVKYRQHSDSCVARFAPSSYYSGRRPLIEWLAGYTAELGVSADSEVARLVRREQWRTKHPKLQTVAEKITGMPGRVVRLMHRLSGIRKQNHRVPLQGSP